MEKSWPGTLKLFARIFLQRSIASLLRQWPHSDPNGNARKGLSPDQHGRANAYRPPNRSASSETGFIIPNPTIGTLKTYARALGRKLAWTLQEVGDLLDDHDGG